MIAAFFDGQCFMYIGDKISKSQSDGYAFFSCIECLADACQLPLANRKQSSHALKDVTVRSSRHVVESLKDSASYV
jgi:hypothetical protein